MNRLKLAVKALLTGLLFGVALQPARADQLFSDQASFLASVSSPAYVESFNSFTDGSPLSGSAGSWVAPGANGFGFTVSAMGGLYSLPGALSANDPLGAFTFTFNGPVTAFGGNFYASGFTGVPAPATIQFASSSGTTSRVVNGINDSFFGVVASAPITSLVVSFTQSSLQTFMTADNLVTGAAAVAAVPEPETYALMLLGLAAIGIARKRNLSHR